jgi:hypothetical protein
VAAVLSELPAEGGEPFGAKDEFTSADKVTGEFFESGSVKSGTIWPTCGAP